MSLSISLSLSHSHSRAGRDDWFPEHAGGDAEDEGGSCPGLSYIFIFLCHCSYLCLSHTLILLQGDETGFQNMLVEMQREKEAAVQAYQAQFNTSTNVRSINTVVVVNVLHVGEVLTHFI